MKRLLLPLALLAVPAAAQTAPQFPDRPIARAEVLAVLKRQFAAMDANRDGTVSRAEFNAFLAHQSPAPPSGVESLAHVGPRWFDRTDTNTDGRITPAEAAANPLRLFDLADINRDGIVSVAERTMAMALMRLGGQ